MTSSKPLRAGPRKAGHVSTVPASLCNQYFNKRLKKMITPNVKAVNFAKEIRGRRLNGSVIRELEVDSEVSCRLQCVEENDCLSYNFEFSENKKKFTCQLSHSDRFVGLKKFTEDHEFLYRGIKVITREGLKQNSNIRASNSVKPREL